MLSFSINFFFIIRPNSVLYYVVGTGKKNCTRTFVQYIQDILSEIVNEPGPKFSL